MDEVFEISDRVLVFRDGQPTGEFNTKDITLEDIVQSMIGRTLDDYFHKSHAVPGDEVIRVEKLCLKGVYQDISFHVRKGEIVGLYGLVGAGRTEIVETIFGIRRPDSGEIYLNGKQVKIRNSVDAVQKAPHWFCTGEPQGRRTRPRYDMQGKHQYGKASVDSQARLYR